jgi:hypothetical protein
MPARIPTKTKVIRFKTQNPFMRTSEIAKKLGYRLEFQVDLTTDMYIVLNVKN